MSCCSTRRTDYTMLIDWRDNLRDAVCCFDRPRRPPALNALTFGLSVRCSSRTVALRIYLPVARCYEIPPCVVCLWVKF